MSAFQPVVLWTDMALFALLACAVMAGIVQRGDTLRRAAWKRVLGRPSATISLVLLAFYLAVGVLDSLHFRRALPPAADGGVHYAAKVESVLDRLLAPLHERAEKTYSSPLASHAFVKDNIERDGGVVGRDYPRLAFGGAHLGDAAAGRAGDIAWRLGVGAAAGLVLALALGVAVRRLWSGAANRDKEGAGSAARAGWWTFVALAAVVGAVAMLASGYHVFGTDKVGQDVLYLTLKSVRTALIIGALTTVVTLPIAVALGITAGYLGGWVDDLIQYLYTVINSIPGVLLIAAAVLMMQVVIETHPDWFATAAERADARLLALCVILGMTSWTGLCRLLRAETLKLRELEYVQAARAFGVGTALILRRHVLPNLMHIVLIALVMDFSALVLAEAVLSYVGIGVDPSTISFGTMINAARMELARDPAVWWSLAAAFVVMFALVLAANLLADAVREAFDPRAA
ncbi:MAG: ABC transporter permease [Rhodocyclaceae bacterium]|nr:ABC transporter permease [Rhodocyclaceae bacterium]